MKLVDILARDLKGWDADLGNFAVQDPDRDNTIWQVDVEPVYSHAEWRAESGYFRQLIGICHVRAEDYDKSIVTRAEWQAAVDALKDGKSGNGCQECAARSKPAVGEGTRCGKLVVRNGVWVEEEWNGEGLPPVGTDVEVFSDYSHPRFDRFIGRKVHIVAHDVVNGDPVAVFRMPIDGDDTEQDYHAMVARSFRPIRTPEQIATEEREAGISEIEKWIKLMPHKNARQAAQTVWDAGYRKQVMP